MHDPHVIEAERTLNLENSQRNGGANAVRSDAAPIAPTPEDLAIRTSRGQSLDASQISQYRRIVVLTEGRSSPQYSKTAISILRYRPLDVVAVLDSTMAGRSADSVFGVGANAPIVSSLSEAPDADSLFIGIAPPGGKLPKEWRPLLLEAIDRGLHIVAGLHDFLANDDELRTRAEARGVTLIDVRRNFERYIAQHARFSNDCLRLHTVGQDCSVGKMTVALELERGLQALNIDAKFLATGQTGIMLRGDGVPIDCVAADFVNGAAERLVLENESHEIVLVEGQGSICHPSFSAVTTGLLHGCAPDAMILCYEVGRTTLKSLHHVPVKPLAELIELYERAAAMRHPSQVIGIAMNSRFVSEKEADEERSRLRMQLGLPVCDVFRHGVDELLEPVVSLWQRRIDRLPTPSRSTHAENCASGISVP